FFGADEPWAEVSPGQVVKIQGRFPDPAFLEPSLGNCMFVQAGENPAIRVTASELAKEHETDTAAATDKYKDKPLIIDGEVAKPPVTKGKQAYVTLKCDGKVRVVCVFDKDRAKRIKSGQPLKAFGVYSSGSGEEISVAGCELITGYKP